MRAIRVGSFFGIPILVHPTWVVPLGVVVWVLAFQVYPHAYPQGTLGTYLAMALASAALFFTSLVLHEMAHSVLARAYHIPVRSITLFLLGGVAQITREPSKPLAELAVAIVGPLTSAALGGALLAAWYVAGGGGSALDVVIVSLGGMNIVIAAFNLLPIFPMDGGRIFRAVVWLLTGNPVRATSIAAWSGRGIAWAMIAGAVLILVGADLRLAASPADGAWFLLMGLFLETATRQALRQNRLVDALRRYRASDLMTADPPVVDLEMTIDALARAFEINPRACYFVEEEGRLAGILSAHELGRVDPPAWATTTAADVMVPRSDLHPVRPDALASDILLQMESDDLLHMPVVDDGRVVGVIGRDRIVGVLRQAGLIGSG
ncbi:MAG: site-2 protease family protein [Dehalococcoidia bacterium]